MASYDLDGVRVAVLAADGFEQVEVTRPVKALRDHGARVEIVSLRPGAIQGMNLLMPGKSIRVDRTVFDADPEAYDALLLPGGFVSPDLLRQNAHALEFVREFDRAGKPIATICHGPWLLVSARVVAGRRLASWPGIRDDVRNAGGIWQDEAVVRDGNWISSRGPQDLPQFNRAMLSLFAELAPTAYPAALGMGEEEEHGGLGLGGLLVSSLVVAALGYGARRVQQQGMPEMPDLSGITDRVRTMTGRGETATRENWADDQPIIVETGGSRVALDAEAPVHTHTAGANEIPAWNR